MDPTASIRRLGFRKWYERELVKSHGALVTCFLCGLTVAAPPPMPSNVALAFRDVEFAYRDGFPVLRGINLDVHAGELAGDG